MNLLAGCGGSSVGTTPIAKFPGRDALAAIGSNASAVSPKLPKMAGALDRWDIEAAPQADAAQKPWEPAGPWETMFAEVATGAQKKPRLPLSMACAARELGRFYMEHKEAPDETLRRFILGGCGSLVPKVVEQPVTLQVPASVKDDQLFEKMGGDLRTVLEKALSKGVDIAGFWFGRRDDQVVAYLVGSNEKAQIKPFALTPDAHGEVVIEGRLNEEARYFEAFINYGSVAAAPCDVDISVPRPAFRFVCKMYEKDDAAWVQMLYAPPQRMLGTVFAQTLVRRSPDVPPRYVAIRYADPAPVSTPTQFTSTVVQQLNRVRKVAGLSAVTLAAAETRTAAKVAPQFFTSVLGQADPEKADTIALGLLAGWEVEGTIRDGSLMYALMPTLDAGRWLTSALEMPIGRATLLAPDIEQVALGPVVSSEQSAIGSVVTGYRFHHGDNHDDDVKFLLSRVVQSRRRMGLAPPGRLATEQAMKIELADVYEGTATPEEAMNGVLQRASHTYGMGMRGFAIEASSLEELQIPEEVLNQPTLHLDIGVTHHKAPGAAWAQYTILVVYAVFPNDKA
jgi:hypothetical protein